MGFIVSYFKYVLMHKYYVYDRGMMLGIGWWQLIVHDWHKFLPEEFMPYAKRFYGPSSKRVRGKEFDQVAHDMATKADFDRAWLHHQKRGRHHWQYWILVYDSDPEQIVCLPMPEKYMLEMVADWSGANLANGGDGNIFDWYSKQRERILLHPVTRSELEELIGYRETFP